MTTLEQVRHDLTRTLAAWSVASIAGGAVLAWRRGGPRAAGFARQSMAWGGIDLAIAAAGAVGARNGVQDREAETASLRRLLLLNAALDVGYVAVGAALLRARTVRGRDSVGDGAGVVVQGAFLLVLDLTQAARLRTTDV
ncbi:DUF6992 family protein [Aquipuribacter sp. MA13-6]|uniref:DUF6992 family protein n=1 Tax=unclassified Aquipuribacter TaxID=2635084 RepID=UPI003EEF1FE1